ncbi:MAG: EamA family transporter [Helicobacteraceae bacterium]|jgi:multidrug transporter EmrE-like cation transporter|nr:EamA family transporter [Helicobacteraceae bacterium]
MKDIWLIFASLFFNVSAQLLLRSAMTSIGSVTTKAELVLAFPAMIASFKLWFGALSFALSFIFWIMALSKYEVGFAYAFFSLGFVIVAICSYFIFQEQMTPLKIIGIALIVIGIICVARSVS